MSVPISIRAQLADIAARVSSVGQARALCGWATAKLAEGYAWLGDISVAAVGLEDQTKSLLDQANAYAAKVYAQLPTDDASQANDLELNQKLKVAEVLRECSEATASAVDAAGLETFSWDDYVQAIKDIATTVGAAAGKALDLGATGVLTLAWSFVRQTWWVLLIVLVAVIVIRRKLAHAAAKVVLG